MSHMSSEKCQFLIIVSSYCVHILKVLSLVCFLVWFISIAILIWHKFIWTTINNCSNAPVFFVSLAAVTCLFSLVCALVLGFLDKRAEKILHKEEGKTGADSKIKSLLLSSVFPFSPHRSITTRVAFAACVDHDRLGVIYLKLTFWPDSSLTSALSLLLWVLCSQRGCCSFLLLFRLFTGAGNPWKCSEKWS